MKQILIFLCILAVSKGISEHYIQTFFLYLFISLFALILVFFRNRKVSKWSQHLKYSVFSCVLCKHHNLVFLPKFNFSYIKMQCKQTSYITPLFQNKTCELVVWVQHHEDQDDTCKCFLEKPSWLNIEIKKYWSLSYSKITGLHL